MDLILASASARRQELLKRIVPDFKIIVSNFNEEAVKFTGNPEEHVKKLALGKACCVAESVENGSVIIGCDTIVYHKGKVLGKPKNKQEAFNMLKSLSNDVHEVYSGLAVVKPIENIVRTESVCTKVFFSELTDNQIYNYIDSDKPYDKAGAYGIQEKAGVFVYKIEGCYYNVVGLPLNCLYNMLKGIGVNL